MNNFTKKIILIGVSGKKYCGKTLFANIVKELFPTRTFIVSFADALKDEVCKACDIEREFLEANKKDFRLIMQGWGTDFRRRHNGDDYWIRKWGARVAEIADNHPNAIIITPDVRFHNEAAAITNCNGLLVRIERLECDIDDQHPSETSLDNWTFWDSKIDNNGTINEFKQTVQQIIKKLNIK